MEFCPEETPFVLIKIGVRFFIYKNYFRRMAIDDASIPYI
jgi:hypothetical protein